MHLFSNNYFTPLFLVFFSYYLICYSKNNVKAYSILSVVFLIAVVWLRIVIPPEMSKDYIAYVQTHGFEDAFSFIYLLSEPYRLVLYEILSIFSDDQVQITNYYYYFNLLVNSFFFLWLAKIKDISLWKKILLFSLYYIVFSFVWLRASISYILIFYFIYYGYRNKLKLIGFMTPFVHISSISVLYLWSVRFVSKAYLKIGMILILLLITYYFLSSNQSTYILYKIDSYINSAGEKDNYKHQLYFIGILIFVFNFLYYNRKYIFDTLVMSLSFFYVIIHVVNVVAAQRISHYLILVLLSLPVDKKKKSLNIFISRVSFIFIIIFFYKFFLVINFEN